MRPTKILAAAGFAFLLCGCPEESITGAEAADAMAESTVSSQATALTTSSVQISTSFTLGQGAAQAASDIQAFIRSQLACANVELAGGTVTVTYGAKPGNCTYKGQTFSGSHSITVSKNEDQQVVIDHAWTNLSNGIVKVSGTAHVTWDFDDPSRHVAYDMTWTRIVDGRTGHGTGDRTQRPLDGDLTQGVSDDGDLAWEGKAGKWDLSIDGVDWRWQDAVPQAGSYSLVTPKGKNLTLSFGRVDEDTIHVTVSSGKKTFGFDVNQLGAATAKEEN